MTEPLILVVTVAAAAVLTRPILNRLSPPRWYTRARLRGRPGVPVTVVLAAGLVMMLLWTIGERRGVLGVILMFLWIATPLATWLVLRSWRRPSRDSKEVSPK